MTKRMVKPQRWTAFEHTLKTASVAEYGHVAAIELSSGLVVPGATATGLFPIGTFAENATGDGTIKARVKLFEEITLYPFVNDAGPHDVALDDIGNVCYLKDSQTVSTLATGRSKAGRVWWVSSAGVLVQMATNIQI